MLELIAGIFEFLFGVTLTVGLTGWLFEILRSIIRGSK